VQTNNLEIRGNETRPESVAYYFASRPSSQTGSKMATAVLSQTCGYVTARLSIAIVRATHLCLRGSRVPAFKISTRRPLGYGKTVLASHSSIVKQPSD
jgi:hypothetical protein